MKRFLTLLAAVGLAAAGVLTASAAGDPGPLPGGELRASAAVYTLTNVNSGKCLDVEFGATQNFNRVTQFGCHQGAAQLWTLNPVAGAPLTYTLTNPNSNRCLDVAFGGKADFNGVVIYDCYGGPVQQWKFTAAGNNAWTMTNVNSQKCLELSFGGKSDFNAVGQYSCYGGIVQQWTVKYISG